MTSSFMRRLDNWAGVPVCLALGAVERVRRLFIRPPEFPAPDRVRAVLVMKYLGVGSVAEAVPMFRELRRRYPGARIAFLTFTPCAELARLLGCFDEIRAIRTSSLPAFAADVAAAIWWGRRGRFDVSFDLEFFSKFSYILSYLVHARVRVGYFVRVLRYVKLHTHPVPYNASRHVSEAFLAQLDPAPERLLPTGPPAPPALPEAAGREADALLDRLGISQAKCLIAFNVNTSDLSRLRLWPAASYAALAGMLHRSHGATILFVGGPQDRARVEEVLALVPDGVRVANIAGQTTLAGLLALFTRVRLVVSNDSGPLHLAALMGTPTVAFFGAESARIYGPRGPRQVNLDLQLYCSPCLNVYNFKEYDCPYAVRCLTGISPADAHAAAAGLLGGAGR